jgi:hypothetical protein
VTIIGALSSGVYTARDDVDVNDVRKSENRTYRAKFSV